MIILLLSVTKQLAMQNKPRETPTEEKVSY